MEDPGPYTLDETLAIFCLHLVIPAGWTWAAAFVLFRFFDILKPLGIRRIESIGLSTKVSNLLDDLLAALYTFVVIQAAIYAF